jgi:hypothetical protein
MPRTFSDDERVAAEDDRDVMVPTWEAPALVVIETELALEILVGALRAPALHDQPHELLTGHLLWKRTEEVVRGLRFSVAPFNEKPYRLAAFEGSSVLVELAGPDHPANSKRGDSGPLVPCRQVVLRNPPRDSIRSARCLTLTFSSRR